MIARLLKCPMVRKVVPFVLGAAIMSVALVIQQARADAPKAQAYHHALFEAIGAGPLR